MSENTVLPHEVESAQPSGVIANQELLSPDISSTQALTQFQDELSRNDPPSQVHALTTTDFLPQQQLERVLTRVYPSEVTWSTADVAGDIIMARQYPDYLFENSDSVARFVDPFVYFSGGVKVTIQVNGTAMHKGALLAFFTPVQNQAVFSSPACGFWYENRVISAAEPETDVMTLRWQNPRQYCKIHDADDYDAAIGTLYIMVLVPLTTMDGAAGTVSLVVSQNFVEPRLAGPRWVAAAEEIERLKKYKARKRGARKPAFTRPQGLPAAEKPDSEIKESMDGIVSDVAYAAQDLAVALKRVPVIGEVAGQVAPVLGTVGNFASNFGLQMPTVPSIPTTFQQRLLAETPHSYGPVNAIRMAARQDVHSRRNTKIFNSEEANEGNVHYITSLPGLIDLFSLTDSYVPGDLVTSFPAHPMAVFTAVTDVYVPTPLAWMAYHATYFTGDIKYSIRLFTQKFVAATLAIAYLPPGESIPPAYDADLFGDIPTILKKVCGDETIDFSIGMLYDAPYNTTRTQSKNPQSSLLLVDGQANAPTIAVYLATPVISSLNATPVIGGVVLTAGGENFQLYQPVGHSIADTTDPGLTPHDPAFTLTSRTSRIMLNVSSSKAPVGTKPQGNPRDQFKKPFPYMVGGCFHVVYDDYHMADPFDHVNDLLFRAYPFVVTDANNADYLLVNEDNTFIQATSIAWCFRGIRPSIRIAPGDTGVMGVNVWFDLANYNSRADSASLPYLMSHGTPCAAMNGAHVGAVSWYELPYYGANLFLIPWDAPNGGTWPRYSGIKNRMNTSFSGSNVMIFMAYADDTVVGILQFPGYFDFRVP